MVANVALTDTFDVQRIKLNQAIVRGNNDEITIPAAFAQANAGYSTASAAFNRANTANTTAISSFAQGNSTAITVVSAYNHANIAYTHANNAYISSNTLSITVTSAYALTNIAFATAVSAYGQANTAQSTAVAAFAAANAAGSSTTVAAAFNKANSANALAASAYAFANTLNNTTQILTDAASVSWNVAAGKVATLTLTAGVGVTRNIANPTGVRSGEVYILHIIQSDATARSIQAWGSAYKWTAATAPPCSSGSGTRDIFSFVSDGTNVYGSFIPDCR